MCRAGWQAGSGSTWSAVASDAGLRHQLALSRQQCAELQQTVTDLTVKMEEVCGDMMVNRGHPALNGLLTVFVLRP